jgi:platelet-activating factor acetylhydrolase
MHYISIPVHKNATLLPPTSDATDNRWPTVIFSHGLGGSRNAYSHIAGSLASHGVVVICPEHRDGTAVVSFIRDPAAQGRFFIQSTRRMVPYTRIPHTQTGDVWDARNAQLRIRLWELALSYDALERINSPDALSEALARANMDGTTPADRLLQFSGRMNLDPGKVVFAGHSFGAATIVQLLKSTYYAGTPELGAMPDPLFLPRQDSAIRRQITEKNPTVLLDMWCFPLLSAATQPLLHLPLPVYADVPSAPGGSALLAVESEAFFKWKEHLHLKARILSPDPAAAVVSAAAFESPNSGVRLTEPNVFYVHKSAHLNQSDFGILFPWLTKKVFGSDRPERALRLNLRALLQHLRLNDIPVARTWVGDLVDGTHDGKLGVPGAGAGEGGDKGLDDGIHDDKAILDRSESGPVDAWSWIDIVGMGDQSWPGEIELREREARSDGTVTDVEYVEYVEDIEDVEDVERQIESEIEPQLVAAAGGLVDAVQTVVAVAA